MPDNKNSFIVYHDQSEIFYELTDEDAGKLIKAMIGYSRGEDMYQLPQSLKLVFIPIRQQLDRNKENYERVSKINSSNAKKRWKTVPNDANVSDRMRSHTNAYDTDKDNDTDKDIYNQQADSKLIKSVLGIDIPKPKNFYHWQELAVDCAKGLGISPTPSWFKLFRDGSEGLLKATYSSVLDTNPRDPEKYFYKVYNEKVSEYARSKAK